MSLFSIKSPWVSLLPALVLVSCQPSRTAQVASVYIKTAVVGSAGGTLEIFADDSAELEGTKIVIPPLALSENTKITVTLGRGNIPEPDEASVIGPTIELGPSGVIFNIPVTITLKPSSLPAQALTRVYTREGDGTLGVLLPGDIVYDKNNETIAFETTRLAEFQAGRTMYGCDDVVCSEGEICRNGGCWNACVPVDEPLRHFLFVMDTSNSIQVTDPESNRIAALKQSISAYIANEQTLDLIPNVSIGIMGFFGNAAVHTKNALGQPGFSTDGKAIAEAIDALSVTGTNTGYDRALSEVDALLAQSINALTSDQRRRATYDVVLISDGLPFPDNCAGQSNSPMQALERVRVLKLKHELSVASVTFHTQMISVSGLFSIELDRTQRCCWGVDQAPISLSTDCNDDTQTVSMGNAVRAMLRGLAEAGEGTTTFDDAGTVTPPLLGSPLGYSPKSICERTGYVCQQSSNICVPDMPSNGECSRDSECTFAGACVNRRCVENKRGCGDDCAPQQDTPFKVLFIMDESNPMQLMDIGDGRQKAIEAAMADISAVLPNATFRVLAFGASVRSSGPSERCPMFTNDQTALSTFLVDDDTSIFSDYQNVLERAYSDLIFDMQSVASGEGCGVGKTGDAQELSNTHYAVILLGDGTPGAQCNIGFGNDSSAALLCEDADWQNCILKTDCGAVGGTQCAADDTCVYNETVCFNSAPDVENVCMATTAFGGAGESGLRAGSNYNQTYQLRAKVEKIMGLRSQFAIAKIRLHTSLLSLSLTDPEIATFGSPAPAQRLMYALAQDGEGNYREQNPFAVPDLLRLDFAPLSPNCPDTLPVSICGEATPDCPEGTFPEYTGVSGSECGTITKWTGVCVPCR